MTNKNYEMPQNYNKALPLISVHIPKCAGTSFGAVLRKWYRFGFLKHYYKERWALRPRRHRLGWYKYLNIPVCIHGHFNFTRGFGYDTYYPDAQQFITIVRDPWDVHLSNYFYVQGLAATTGFYRDGVAHNTSYFGTLENYLQSHAQSHIPNFFPPEMNTNNYREILEQKFLYVGTFEQLRQSVMRLAEILDFPIIDVGHLNPSKRPKAIAPEIEAAYKAKFREQNALAFAIHDYACEANIEL